jgi:hypothetical protein
VFQGHVLRTSQKHTHNCTRTEYIHRGADNHLPNVSVIQDWRVKIQTHSPGQWEGKKPSPGWRVVSLVRGFSPLADHFYIFGQLFSDLASENAEQFASLASVLKNLSTPLHIHTFPFWFIQLKENVSVLYKSLFVKMICYSFRQNQWQSLHHS